MIVVPPGPTATGVLVGSLVFAACATTTGAICVSPLGSGVLLKARRMIVADSFGLRFTVALPIDPSNVAGSFRLEPGGRKTGLTTLVSSSSWSCSKSWQSRTEGVL